MKKMFIFSCMCCSYMVAFSQSVGIGTTAPNASAILDITNTSKGLLIPRMGTGAITSIANPAKGLMVYDSSLNQLMVNMGTPTTPNWQTIVAKSGWGLNGNSGTDPATNFLGTKDGAPLVFKVNNAQAAYIDTGGVNYTNNTSFGYKALSNNNGGYANTANGFNSLYSNTTGHYNTANGFSSLYSNTSGAWNTANGFLALEFNTTGTANTAYGFQSLIANTSGEFNTAVGMNALISNHGPLGHYNTAVGARTLYNTTNSQYNTAVGYYAGYLYDNGYNNIFLGANTDVNGTGYYNVIAIGQGTICTGSSQVTMGNSATGSYRAYTNWSNISDGRFKKNIQENVPGLDFITQLRPVTYNLNATGLDAFLHKNISGATTVNQKTKTLVAEDAAAKAVYNKALKEKEQIIQTGFVAQEVEATAKTLGFNFSGIDAPKNENDVYGLRYAEFVVPLVKAVQEQQQQIESLKKENAEQKNINITLQNQIDELKALIKK